MSTRGALGFKVNGEYKVTYNHCDSYPGGLGEGVVDFVKGVNIQTLKEKAKKVILIESDKKPTAKEIQKYKKYSDLSVSSGTLKEWYCLLRNIQGIDTFKEIYKGNLGVMIDAIDFLEDSLFCEYAYIINLDENRLEFYEGFNGEFDNGSPLPYVKSKIEAKHRKKKKNTKKEIQIIKLNIIQ